MEMVLHGAKSDLHSGMYGGTVANPGHALCEMIAKLHDADGRVSVPGFYEGIKPLTQEERTAWAGLPFSDEAYAKELGVETLFGEKGYTTLEPQVGAADAGDQRHHLRPIRGRGARRCWPNRASCKITCRLVPGQNGERVTESLEKYLQSIVPAGVRMEGDL